MIDQEIKEEIFNVFVGSVMAKTLNEEVSDTIRLLVRHAYYIGWDDALAVMKESQGIHGG